MLNKAADSYRKSLNEAPVLNTCSSLPQFPTTRTEESLSKSHFLPLKLYQNSRLVVNEDTKHCRSKKKPFIALCL